MWIFAGSLGEAKDDTSSGCLADSGVNENRDNKRPALAMDQKDGTFSFSFTLPRLVVPARSQRLAVYRSERGENAQKAWRESRGHNTEGHFTDDKSQKYCFDSYQPSLKDCEPDEHSTSCRYVAVSDVSEQRGDQGTHEAGIGQSHLRNKFLKVHAFKPFTHVA
jgi:hypothetical protein